jgi:hypothetical protein
MHIESSIAEIAQAAARCVAEDGLDFGSAKRKAIKTLGLPERSALPSNLVVEAEIWAHIALFEEETQPQVLRALRAAALDWMQRLQHQTEEMGERVEVLVQGGVWHGWATAATDVWCQVFCDDPKLPEIALLNLGADFQTRDTASSLASSRGARAETLSVRTQAFDSLLAPWDIGVHFQLHPSVELRGALLPDEAGRKPRGDAAALAARLESGEVARVESIDV